jgi:hypothetical protein
MKRSSLPLLVCLGVASAGLACGAGGSGRSGANVTGANGGAGTSGAPVIGRTGDGPPTVGTNPGGPITGLEMGGDFGSSDPNFSGHPACASNCQDLPADPIIEFGSNPKLFDQASQGSGPCIIEPQDGVMMPANWTRPRVYFSGGGDQHQITVSTPREANKLVAYTTQNPWIMPKDAWDGLRKSVYEEDITVLVRTSSGGAAPRESTTHFRIAPVPAGGSIVFWASKSQQPGIDPATGQDTTQLLGFSPGDEAVISTLTPAQVQGTILDDSPVLKRAQYGVAQGKVRCVGCHTSTPDGDAVTITDHWPWNGKLVSIDAKTVGASPSYLTPLSDLLLQMPWQGTSTFSVGDWGTGARRVITSYEGRPITQPGFKLDVNNPQGAIYPHPDNIPDELAWIDLKAPTLNPDPLTSLDQNGKPLQTDRAWPLAMAEAKGPSWDIIARQGDVRSAVTPDWSHDGKTVVYTSTDKTADGHLDAATEADVYAVPFNAGAGGAATPVAGASDSNFFEYYPDFSADDRFIAFNRVAKSGVQGQKVYYRPESQIYVVPAAGGTATRLSANDPPQCSGESSPGVYNSWPKWSPVVRSSVDGEPYSGRTYYFYTFASARKYPGQFMVGGGQNGAQPEPASQLYMGTLVVNADGSMESYPALYLWNQSFLTSDGSDVQPLAMSNLTPAWDEFVVPPIVVVIQ